MQQRTDYYHRGRRYYPSGKKNAAIRRICLAAVFLLLFLSAAARCGYLGDAGAQIPGRRLYCQALAFTVPGFSQVLEYTPAEPEQKAPENYLRRLALPVLGDPKNLLLAQIPYLGDPGIEEVQTLENDADIPAKPRIIIPVQHSLAGRGRVLIHHTHATESFVPTSGVSFTEDLSLTVVQLGAELAAMLEEEYGIPVVHSRAVHDLPRETAYEKARPELEKLLAMYPDTVLVVDLHRDGIEATAMLDGQPAGQILFVVGNRYEGWEKNLQKAEFLHMMLEEKAPGISRGIRQYPLIYNQDLHTGSLLIELGSDKNSLDEARRTLPLLADALARLYTALP